MKKLLLILLPVLLFSCKKDATPETPPFEVADYPIELVGEWMPVAEKVDGGWEHKDYQFYYDFGQVGGWNIGEFIIYKNGSFGGYYTKNGNNIYKFYYGVYQQDGSRPIDSIQTWYILSLSSDTVHVGQVSENRKNEYLYKINLPSE